MRLALVIVHLSVLAAVIALVLSLELAVVATGAALLIAAGPLALALKGLCAELRYTRQWLSIAMVFYIGFGLVETVASQGQSVSAIALLLIGAAELALLFVALRRAPRGSPGSAG